MFMKFKAYSIVIFVNILAGCNGGGTTPSSATTSITCTENVKESIEECVINSNGTIFYGFNNTPYALCSEALCNAVPGESLASCSCPIINAFDWKSASQSPNNHANSMPTFNLDGSLKTVQSDYSWANNPPYPGQCYFDTPHPWASCFGVRCDVSGDTALCQCPIKYSTHFIFELPSSSCDTPTNQIWSAAPNITGYNNMGLIYGVLYPGAPY
mgnify:CR=1 FL=1